MKLIPEMHYHPMDEVDLSKLLINSLRIHEGIAAVIVYMQMMPSRGISVPMVSSCRPECYGRLLPNLYVETKPVECSNMTNDVKYINDDVLAIRSYHDG